MQLSENQQAEILAVIGKSLPEHMSQMLRSELDLVSKLKKDNQRLTNTVESHVKEIDGLKIDLKQRMQQIRDNEKLVADTNELREQLLKESEKLRIEASNMKVTELTIRLEESEKRSSEIAGFVQSLTRNTEFRENRMKTTIWGNNRAYEYDSNGCIVSDKPVPVKDSETDVKTITKE